MSKLGIVCIVFAAISCGGSKPPSPQPVPSTSDLLRDDVDTFCGPEAAAHATALDDLGPFVEPKLRDTELRKALRGLRDGTVSLDQFQVQVVAMMKQVNVEQCPTLDKLFAPRSPSSAN